MKLNTHDRTPRPQNSVFIKVLLLICIIFIYTIFALVAFACFTYAKTVIGGISVLMALILLTAIILVQTKDIEKAYIEINENKIYVVDYYCGVKKEKHFLLSDITSAEICIGHSHKVKGCRLIFPGIRYIIFKKEEI